jgi:WD40 repeat protein
MTQGGPCKIITASLFPNEKLLASSDDNNDGTGGVRLVTINDRDTNKLLLHDVPRYDDDDDEACVKSVTFTPNRQNLASGGDDGANFLWGSRKFLSSSTMIR